MSNLPRNYTEEERERVYRAWYEFDSPKQAAIHCGVSHSTVLGWIKKYNWKEQKKKDKEYLKAIKLEKKQETLREMKNMAAEIGLSDIDFKTFRDIRIVEKTCIAFIQNDKEFFKENKDIMQPNNFKEAVDALKKCWETKEKMLVRYTKTKAEEDTPNSIINNFFTAVKSTVEPTKKVIDIGGNLLSN